MKLPTSSARSLTLNWSTTRPELPNHKESQSTNWKLPVFGNGICVYTWLEQYTIMIKITNNDTKRCMTLLFATCNFFNIIWVIYVIDWQKAITVSSFFFFWGGGGGGGGGGVGVGGGGWGVGVGVGGGGWGGWGVGGYYTLLTQTGLIRNEHVCNIRLVAII